MHIFFFFSQHTSFFSIYRLRDFAPLKSDELSHIFSNNLYQSRHSLFICFDFFLYFLVFVIL